MFGFVLVFWVQRRRFKRDVDDSAKFTSYSRKMLTTSLEKIIWALGVVLIFVGLLRLLALESP